MIPAVQWHLRPGIVPSLEGRGHLERLCHHILPLLLLVRFATTAARLLWSSISRLLLAPHAGKHGAGAAGGKTRQREKQADSKTSPSLPYQLLLYIPDYNIWLVREVVSYWERWGVQRECGQFVW